MFSRSTIAASPLFQLLSHQSQGLVRAQWAVRPISTSASHLTPVTLAFSEVPRPSPQQQARSQPIVILHGLFGSKQNWKALSKAMASRLNTEVYALDLRNHGESGHSSEHDYANMANDVTHFLKERNLEKPIVIGHSMGGRVAMNMALRHVDLDRLIIVDIAPVQVTLSSEFAKYVEVMKEIQKANVKKQSEADAIMKNYVSDLGVRQFLLTNLKRNAAGDGYSFRIPIETLGKSLETLGHIDFKPGQDRYEGKTLVIKGTKSKYIQKKDEDLIRTFFPNSRIAELETGHWVHAEKPEEFLKLVTEFAVEK